MDVQTESVSQTVVTIRLTIEEAAKLVGLLDAVPVKDEFFWTLAGAVSAQYEELEPAYEQDEDGDYVATEAE